MTYSSRSAAAVLTISLVASLLTVLPLAPSPAQAATTRPAPNDPLPPCVDVDGGGRKGACEEVAAGAVLSATASGTFGSDGASVTVKISPELPVCDSWPNRSVWNPSPCWAGAGISAGGPVHLNEAGDDLVGSGSIFTADGGSYSIAEESLRASTWDASTTVASRCNATRSNFQTYIYGGHQQDAPWRSISKHTLECTLTWDGDRPDNLKGATWIPISTSLSVRTNADSYDESTAFRTWVRVEGDMQNPGPDADFEQETVDDGVRFTNLSTHPWDLGMTYEWDLAGTESTETSPVVALDPGWHFIRLTATDVDDLSDTHGQWIRVTDERLEVTLDGPDEGVDLEVGDEFVVDLSVAAPASNAEAVTGIEPSGQVLGLPSWLEVVSGSIETGFDLDPGTERSATFTLRATGAGEDRVASRWTGSDSEGGVVDGNDDVLVSVQGVVEGEWFREDLLGEYVREDATTDVRLRVDNETGRALSQLTLVRASAVAAGASGEEESGDGTDVPADPGAGEDAGGGDDSCPEQPVHPDPEADDGDEGDGDPGGDEPGGEEADEPAAATLTQTGLGLPTTLDDTGPGSVGFADFELTGVAPGDVVLCAEITARTAGGDDVHEVIEATWEVKPVGLEVEVTPKLERPDGSAPELNTDNDGDGDVDDDDHRFDVEVRITNTTDDAVTDVHFLDEAEPVDWSNNLVGEDQGAPKLTLLGNRGDEVDGPDGPQPGPIEGLDVEIPDLAASGEDGDSHVVTFVYEATGEIDATGQSVVLGAQDLATVRGSGEADAVFTSGTLLKFGTKLKEPFRLTTSGQVVRLGGFLENLDEDETDESGAVTQEARSIAVWITPLVDGNAGGGVLTTRDGGRTPLGPEFIEVAPGERLELHGILATLASPKQTFAEVEYLISAWQVPTTEGDTALPLADERIEVVTDEDEGYAESHSKRLRFADVDHDDIKECETEYYGQVVGCNFLLGLQSLGYNTVDALRMVEQGVGEIGSSTYWVGNWAMHELEDSVKALRGDPAAIERLATEMEVQLETFKALGILTIDTGVSAVGVLDSFYAETERVLDEGDTAAGLAWVSKFAGENPDLLFSAVLKARGLAALGQATLREGTESAAGAIVRETVEAEARAAQRAIDGNVESVLNKGLDPKQPVNGALRSGLDITNNPKVWRDLYGAARDDMQKLFQIAQEEGILIAFRSRNPISIKLLEQGKAWLKPQSVKAKNVNAIDVTYLGFPQDSFGKVVMVEPPVNYRLKGAELDAALDAHMAKLKKAHPELADEVYAKEVRARLELRTKKFEEHLSEWLEYANDGMPVGFDGAANGVRKGSLNVTEYRDVNVEMVTVPDPYNPGQTKVRFDLKVAGPDGGDYRHLTGDIDVVGFFNLDRTPIMGAKKRERIYEKMRATGMQHGETLTWEHRKRAEILRKDHIGPESELLVVAGPDERAYLSQLDESKSSDVFAGENFKHTFSLLDGPPVELRSPVRGPGPAPSGILNVSISSNQTVQALERFKQPAQIVDNLKKIAKESGGQITVEDQQSKDGPAVMVLPDGRMVIYRVPDGSFAKLSTSPAEAPGRSGLRAASFEVAAAGSAPTTDPAVLAQMEAFLGDYRHTFPRPSVGRLGGVWEEISFAAAAAEGDPDVLELPLTSWTDVPVQPGATELSVLLAEELGVPGGDWFAAGDRVVFDPGGAYEQVLTLTAVDGNQLSFARADALLPDHGDVVELPAGIQVLFLPASVPADGTGDGATGGDGAVDADGQGTGDGAERTPDRDGAPADGRVGGDDEVAGAAVDGDLPATGADVSMVLELALGMLLLGGLLLLRPEPGGRRRRQA